MSPHFSICIHVVRPSLSTSGLRVGPVALPFKDGDDLAQDLDEAALWVEIAILVVAEEGLEPSIQFELRETPERSPPGE